MPNFVLIDHSLERLGGHHYEYAVHVLREAEAAGYEVTLATNRRFRNRSSLPRSWRVLPSFRYDTYSPYANVGQYGLRPIDRVNPESWLGRLRTKLFGDDRRRRINDFVASCAHVVQRVDCRAGDHVFLATMSDFDLIAFVEFLKANPRSKDIQWHLQFHFSIVDGRPPAYPQQQQRLDAMRQLFKTALAEVPNHHLRFYNTTEDMTAQYNMLGVTEFKTLPYPISPTIGCGGRDRLEEPLGVTCAGHIRAEKGRHVLHAVVDDLWDEYFRTGRIQLAIQGKERKHRHLLGGRSIDAAIDPITFVRHPLPVSEYSKLIDDSDIALFMYDSDRYVGRCSGILVEMLAAGVPVIVPAGCWLSDQLAEPIQQHLDHLHQSLDVVHHCDGLQLNKRKAKFGGQSYSLTSQIAIPNGSTEVLISFCPTRECGKGTYIRVASEQGDQSQQCVKRDVSIVERRASGVPTRTMFRMKPGAETLTLGLSNAYDEGHVTVNDLEIRFVTSGGSPCAAGQVGLIAADQQHFPELLRDIVDHYPHYRETTERFAKRWREEHHPQNAVSIILDGESTPQRQRVA